VIDDQLLDNCALECHHVYSNMANPRTAAFAEDPQAPSRSAADEIDVKAAFTNFPKLIGINSSLSNVCLYVYMF
jgi:hypothetical protein